MEMKYLSNKVRKFSPLVIFILVIIVFVLGYFALNSRTSSSLLTTTDSNAQSKAISILEVVPEIRVIKDSVIKAGGKPFYTQDGQNGDVVTVSLRDSFPDDAHTSRIDTFNVNIKTSEITVEDVATNEAIPLVEWKKTVADRFK